MRGWVVDRAGYILAAAALVCGLAGAGINSMRLHDELDAHRTRMSEYCGFERTHLELIDLELRSTNASTVIAAEHDLTVIADADFREVRLCAPEGAPLDPNDAGRMCMLVENAGESWRAPDYDVRPCMRRLVTNLLLYVRGR